MNLKLLSNFLILAFLSLVFVDTSYAQGCRFRKFPCITNSEFQLSKEEFPKTLQIACDKGKNYVSDREVQHWKMIKCCPDEACTKQGILPNLTIGNEYHLCVKDAHRFLKCDFKCPEGFYFSRNSLICLPRYNYPKIFSGSIKSKPDFLNSLMANTSEASKIAKLTNTINQAPLEIPETPTTTTTTPSTTTTTTPSTTTSATPSTTMTTTAPSTTTTTTAPSTTTTTTTQSSTTTTTPSTTTTTTPSTTTTTTPSTTTTTTPATTTETTPPPTVCLMAGIFPHPTNCKMYYRCNTSLKLFYFVCPGNSYFNHLIMKCSLNKTPACLEQISKNSTSVG